MFRFTELEKLGTLKTEGIVIYPGKSDGDNNDYYKQKDNVTYIQWPKNVKNHH